MSKQFRDWDCSCGYSYSKEVKLSAFTTNLSGEETAWCPRCGKKPLSGSPAYTRWQWWRRNLGRFVPHKAKHHSTKDQWLFAILGALTFYEGLVIFLSLGLLSVDVRSWFLFQEWWDT